MNEEVKKVIKERKKYWNMSFILLAIGIIMLILLKEMAPKFFAFFGGVFLILGWIVYDRTTYHLGALKGYDMGYEDCTNELGYNIIAKANDADIKAEDLK